MKVITFFIVVFCLLLTGCASKIRSEVTAFHHWPTEIEEKYFRFVHIDGETNGLERQSYQSLISAELTRLGLREAIGTEEGALMVSFNASVSARDVLVIETVLVDSWYGTPWHGTGYYSPFWGGWPGYGPTFYGPYSPGIPVPRQRERRFSVFDRELKLKITNAASSQPLFETTVRSEGKEGNLVRVMPYLVRSAFTDFPGKSGKPHVIEMKFDPAN